MSAGAGTFAATGLVCAQNVRVGTFLNYGPKLAARICHVRYVSALGALAAFRCVSGEMLQSCFSVSWPSEVPSVDPANASHPRPQVPKMPQSLQHLPEMQV